MEKIRRLPKNYQDLINEIKLGKSYIYIFGADIAGKVVMKILEKEKIIIRGFIDNNKNKCIAKIKDKEVFHSGILKEIKKNAIILIASTYVDDLVQQIENHGFYNWALVNEILSSNKDKRFDQLLDNELMTNYSGGEFTKDFVNFAAANMIESQKKYLDPSWLYIRSVDLIVSEKCSLKCKDCSNLMQYYEKPINVEKNELIDDLKILNEVSDEINEIRIIGGEPLMNKDFHIISSEASKYNKFNKVVIYTNGTICPSDEKLKYLSNDKTFVFITTYGPLSKNAQKLADACERNKINYNKQPAYGWTDSGKIKDFSRKESVNKALFKKCCAKHFATMTDGKIFRCPFSSNLERLKALPESSSDFFDLRKILKKEKDLIKIKKDLMWFLREKDNLIACNFCNGRSYGQKEIEPGIQTKKNIFYKQYERHNPLIQS